MPDHQRHVPFGSHPVNTLRWWDEFSRERGELGAFIARHGLRVSMHPGQFTVLNSVEPRVVDASISELRWHAQLLDSLKTGTDCKIVVHVGGSVGGKDAAMDRFVAAARTLPDEVRRRLVVENDERLYTAEDAVAISMRTGLPVVFDWLHHRANPGACPDPHAVIARCFATWGPGDGVPKVHLSSQASGGRPGKHADWVDPADAAALLRDAPAAPFDCMLEAKKKDLALFRLRSDLGEL